jgi:hypothetical protein
MTTPAIRKAVLAKFCAPEWATFLEVHNGTGSTQRRSADAIAMNLFPSRGLRLHGFEFKASRSDWMRELKDPAKSVPIQRYCDHWWIVALPDIVRADELPPNWGLYVLKGSGLHAIVKAPQLERDPIDPPFLAALLRRAHEFAGRELNEEMKKHTAEAEARMEARLEERVQWRTRELKQYKEALDAFEAAAGFKLETWDAANLGAAARMIGKLGITGSYLTAQSIADSARRFADRVETALAEAGVRPEDDLEAAA